MENISGPPGGPLRAADAEGGVNPLALYASGIDGSDYVARLAPLLRAALPRVGDLLDVGAGGGQLGAALRDPGAAWIAVEPAPVMQARLRALAPPPALVPAGWQEADLPDGCADTVLAANMAGPLAEPVPFLARCRAWARRDVAWVVPAQAGPRGLCLAGCLPREWHGEDETPGVEIVLGSLPAGDRPAIVARVDWTFRATVPSVPGIAAHLADRLGLLAGDARRAALSDHLSPQAEAVPGGHRLSVPRSSAVLVWRKAS